MKGGFRLLFSIYFQLIGFCLYAQQVMDSSFILPSFDPAFGFADKPVALIDRSHYNNDIPLGNYYPFFQLLEKDGYRITYLDNPVSEENLERADIFIIINALNIKNRDIWAKPVYPAFTGREEQVIYDWVTRGGSFLLVADHMPFPGAVSSLARKFGAEFSDGFALDSSLWDPLVFKISDNTLKKHPMVPGRNSDESVDSVVTFFGQAFQYDPHRLHGIFQFGEHIVSYYPDTAWQILPNTPVKPVTGWYQAAAGKFGMGRAVMLGEAGMLTAQLTGPNRVKIGFNSPQAGQNWRFILNMMHWLSSLIP